MSNLANFEYKGHLIQRREDGMVNLTQMCKPYKKRLRNWRDNAETKEYIELLQNDLHLELVKVIEVTEGRRGGTWGHPTLAKHLDEWLKRSLRRTMVKHGSIYIFADNGNNAYKVGFTTNLRAREKQHKTSNPFLELVKAYDDCTIEQEIIIHEKLEKYRIPGTQEWYQKRPCVLKVISLVVCAEHRTIVWGD